MTSSVEIIVTGVTGRMGKLIASEALNDRRHTLVGATCRQGPRVGDDVGDILGRGSIGLKAVDKISSALESEGATSTTRRVVVDFTRPELVTSHALACASAGVALLVGTTGLDDAAHAALEKAAESVPVLLAANTSLGANILSHYTASAARGFQNAGVEVDHEVVEIHHRQKRDAPSGTALDLARSITAGTAGTVDNVVSARSGASLRGASDVGVMAVRGGTVAGEHTVYFFLEDERVEFTHRVADRRVFATGALTAARFLSAKSPGWYSMANVLSLD